MNTGCMKMVSMKAVTLNWEMLVLQDDISENMSFKET